MFNIINANKHRSPADPKVKDTVIAIIDNFFEKTKLPFYTFVKQVTENRIYAIGCLLHGLLMLMPKTFMLLW